MYSNVNNENVPYNGYVEQSSVGVNQYPEQWNYYQSQEQQQQMMMQNQFENQQIDVQNQQIQNQEIQNHVQIQNQEMIMQNQNQNQEQQMMMHNQQMQNQNQIQLQDQQIQNQNHVQIQNQEMQNQNQFQNQDQIQNQENQNQEIQIQMQNEIENQIQQILFQDQIPDQNQQIQFQFQIQNPQEISPFYDDSKAAIILKNVAQWTQFSRDFKEMFVNNSGRELFPAIAFSANHLNPTTRYAFSITLKRLGDHKWKFIDEEWLEDPNTSCSDVPSESPEVFLEAQPGIHWMTAGISFPKIFTIGADKKIGKRGKDQSAEALEQRRQEQFRKVMKQCQSQLQVHTRVQYYPRIQMFRVGDEYGELNRVIDLELPEVRFITVTAYKATACKAMKSGTNKFVRGDIKEKAHGEFKGILEKNGGSISEWTPVQNDNRRKRRRDSMGSSSSGSSANSSMADQSCLFAPSALPPVQYNYNENFNYYNNNWSQTPQFQYQYPQYQ